MINNIVLTVFTNAEESGQTETALRKLVPFILEDNKLELESKRASGFGDKTIYIKTITINKSSLSKMTISHLLKTINDDDRLMIFNTISSRLSEENHFYIRLKKGAWMNDEAKVSDEGDCFHIKFLVQTFPAKRENAIREMEELFFP